MQKVAREFLRFKHGMLLTSLLESNVGNLASIERPSLTQPLQFISTSRPNSSSGLNSFKRALKKCNKQCRRGRLPWERDEAPQTCRGIVPFRRAVEEYIELEEIEYDGRCRYCPPSCTGKGMSRKKKKKKTPSCKPFHDQDLISKKKTECEKRRISKCIKTACNPEVECANLGPVCKKGKNKRYPMDCAVRKSIPGCPTPGWQVLHKKAREECKHGKKK